ncbi:MAG: DinB family protein [Anaerolineaceae bacterium]
MTQPQEDLDRIRGYLQQQAAQRTIDELIARVQEGVDDLATAARGVPDTALNAIPAGDEWTPLDCLRHAMSFNMHVAQQVLFAALEGHLPTDGEPEVPADRDAVLAAHAEALDSLYIHVRAADPEGNLELTWKHPFFGELNWREWLLFLRIHSRDHARQLAAMSGARA